MERAMMEAAIIEIVITGMKAAEVLSSSKEFEQRIDLHVRLAKGASNEQLEDMIGFIGHSKKHTDNTPAWIAVNLLHDINGLANEEEGFSPRTWGYKEKV